MVANRRNDSKSIKANCRLAPTVTAPLTYEERIRQNDVLLPFVLVLYMLTSSLSVQSHIAGLIDTILVSNLTAVDTISSSGIAIKLTT